MISPPTFSAYLAEISKYTLAVIRLPRCWSKALIEGLMLISKFCPASDTVTREFSSPITRSQSVGYSDPAAVYEGLNNPTCSTARAVSISSGCTTVRQHIFERLLRGQTPHLTSYAGSI